MTKKQRVRVKHPLPITQSSGIQIDYRSLPQKRKEKKGKENF